MALAHLRATDFNMQEPIRTEPKPLCVCCQSEGTYAYRGMKDRLFEAPGVWNIKQCNNQACGLLWLDPSPVAEDLHKAYQSYYTHTDTVSVKESLLSQWINGYRASRYHFKRSQSSILSRLFGNILSLSGFFKENMDYPFVYLAGQNKGKLLELGCGSGATLKLFSEWGWQAQGLDFDAQAVNNAQAKGLTVNHGDIFSQHFPDNHFDAIFSSHVVEHVPDPLALLEESFRILKPKGIFVAVMPNSDSKLHRQFKASWRELDPPRHLHIFNPQSLRRMTDKTRFKSIDIKTSNYSAAGVWFMSYKIAKHGSANMHDRSRIRYFGQLVRFYLQLTHGFSKLSGEELILIAQK